MRIYGRNWPRDMFRLSLSQSDPFLILDYQGVYSKSNTTDITSGAGTATFPENLSSCQVLSGVRVARSLVFYVVFCRFCLFSFGHCIACLSIYSFWLHLWYLHFKHYLKPITPALFIEVSVLSMVRGQSCKCNTSPIFWRRKKPTISKSW